MPQASQLMRAKQDLSSLGFHMMKLKVCPSQYVGEGIPDKMGDENLGICKECVKLVIIMKITVIRGDRYQGTKLRDNISCLLKLPRICMSLDIRR